MSASTRRSPAAYRPNAPRRLSKLGDRGFTLLEVVVGLVLMSTVLVSSLLAYSAHQHQLRAAEAKLAAVTIADELMTRFVASREGIPRASRGPLAEHPGWYWQTRTVGVAAPAGIPVQVIRLEVLETIPNRDPRVLAQIDVVQS